MKQVCDRCCHGTYSFRHYIVNRGCSLCALFWSVQHCWIQVNICLFVFLTEEICSPVCSTYLGYEWNQYWLPTLHFARLYEYLLRCMRLLHVGNDLPCHLIKDILSASLGSYLHEKYETKVIIKENKEDTIKLWTGSIGGAH